MEHTRLLRTIEEQNRKIETYKTKLRDVVQAYKDLQKEKEALEATVSALNQPLEVTSSDKTDSSDERKAVSDPLNTAQANESDDSSSIASAADETGNQPRELSVEESLRQQVATLTNSLVTVTQQKSKLEAISIAEKKKLRHDLEEKETTFQEERQNLLKQIQGLENDLEQWRTKIRNHQHEQETEQQNYAVMMRELQQLLTTERISKVNVETQLEDVQLQLAENQRMLIQKSELYEKSIAKQRDEIESLRSQLKASKETSNEPSSLLMHLQKELLDLKEHEKRSVLHEQQRSTEAESRLAEVSQQNEERVASLEAKISEFSEMIGTAERLRNQDHQTIQKLRERIIQLDLENTALASATSANSGANADEDLELPALIEKMLRLKELFKSACERADKPADLYEALQLDQETASHDSIHKNCHELYEQLREEFERYKLRAQSVLKNKSSRDSGPEQEVVILKTQMAELREKFGILRRNLEDQELKLKEKEEYFSKALTAMAESHKSDCLQKDTDHRQKIGELDLEIRRHRERTIALLAEKDREISALRLQLPPRIPEVESRLMFQPLVPSSPEPDASEVGASSEEASAVTELLQHNTLIGIPGDTKLLHFSQEQGRKEVEIATLRRQKHNLEAAVREQQQNFHMKEQELIDKIRALEELVKKHERDKSRESANLEYLKNVIYHYLMSTEQSGRLPMLNAITTILEFSPKEKQQVNLALSRGWWTYKHSSSK